ncbi:MAG TPA: PilZ domain-containing protein [Gammaproteobacteria bacterium]|nr:PilZ domain-containing protein [Gammaproteobacteria bacterium]
MEEKRQYVRTAFSGHVRLSHASLDKDVDLEMRDLSDGGLFLLCGGHIDLEVGEHVQIQSLDIDDAPVLEARIVRREVSGIALIFILD